MKKMVPVLWLLIFSLATGSSSPAAGRDNADWPGGEIWIRTHKFTYNPDGSLSKDQSHGRATVGFDIEFVQGASKSQVRFGRPIVPSDWGTSLVARTELKRGEGILLHLEWREKGKLIRTEEVVSRNFDSVTRTLLVEPETGLKHVVQFSFSTEGEGKLQEEARRVDRMKLNPGGFPGPLLREGKLLALIRGFGDGFEKLYINMPGTGFFQFSLHPFPGSEPAGRLEGAVLAFEWRGSKYQWFLGSSPLPEGAWTVFVKATDEIPPECRDAIRPEFAGEIVVGGSNGPP